MAEIGFPSGFCRAYGGHATEGDTPSRRKTQNLCQKFSLDADQAGTVGRPQRAPESVIPHSLILLSSVL